MITIKTHGVNPDVNMDVITETLIIDRFQQNSKDGGDSTIYSERGDIIEAYLNLPSKDKREIHKKYRDGFGKYGIILRMRSTCIHCSNEEEIELDLVSNFFRMVYTT